MATGRKSKTKQSAPEDKYKAILTFDSREAGGRFVRKHPWDLVGTRLDKEGRAVLTFYLTQTQIKYLEKEGVSLDIRENVSEIGRARQKEIGSGDRFDGGKIAPRPLGLVARGEK